MRESTKKALIALAILTSIIFGACEGEDVDKNYHGSFGDGLGIAHKFEELQK